MTTRAPAEITALAEELRAARAARALVTPPSARGAGFDLDDGYAVEAELRRLRRAEGRRTVGLKVGYANRAMWRALKLETLVWAAIYDDTVSHAPPAGASLSIAGLISPKIEPEIMVKLARPVASTEAAVVLESVEWLALGFEIIDCPFPDWKYQPADFVASFGLHAALVVGEPRPVTPASISELVDQLAQCKLRLSRDGELVDEGGGRNALKSPALCAGELASAIGRRSGAEPIEGGSLISTGALTTSQPAAAGQRWTAEVDGIDLPAVSVALRS